MMEDNFINRKYIKSILFTGSTLILLYIIFVEVWAAAYTVYCADDFSNALALRAYENSIWEFMYGCIIYTKNTYMNWQGTYFSAFVQAILNPLNAFGLPQLRIVMVLNALMFFFSLIFFILTFSKVILKQSYHTKVFYCACVVFIIVNSRAYTEIFYWFCGAMVYCIPTTCLLISLSFFILSNIAIQKKIICTVLAMLFSIGSQGGVLAISGSGCYAVFVLCLLFWMQTKKFSPRNLGIVLVYCCGAIINVIAPGNYVRHAVIEEGMHPILAVKQAIILYIKEIKLVTINDKFCTIFLLLILCGILLYGNIQLNMKVYTIISVLLSVTPIVTIYPVMLGYGSNAISNFPNRAFFVVNTVTVLALSNMAILAGYWMAAFIKVKGIKSIGLTGAFGVLILVLLVRMFVHFDLSDMFAIRTSKQLYDGTIQTYYRDCKAVFEYLSECDEGDVMIEEFPAGIENFNNFEISASPDHWINQSVAAYYNLNSIGYEKLVGRH